MCTIGFDHNLNVIFKNRDKNIATKEEFVIDKDFIAVRTKGKPYYSLGFNRFGCGFASAAVNSTEWTHLAGQGKREEARELFERENIGLVSPMILVSRMLSDTCDINEWITAIEGSEDNFMGYNIIFVDQKSAKSTEVFRSGCVIKTLKDKSVVTNHFRFIDFGPRLRSDYPNSFERYEYAQKSLLAARTLDDIFNMLKPKDDHKRKLIWRNGHFFTVSTSVIDLDNRYLYYADDADKDYRCIESKGV